MGLLTLPLKSQTLFDKVAFEGPTRFLAATGPWKIAYIYSFNVCFEMFVPRGRQIRSMYKKYASWRPTFIALTLSTVLYKKQLWINIHRKSRLLSFYHLLVVVLNNSCILGNSHVQLQKSSNSSRFCISTFHFAVFCFWTQTKEHH